MGTRKRQPVEVNSNRFPTSQPGASRSGSFQPGDEAKPRIRPISSLINQLMSRRGYAQVLAGEAMHEAVAAAVDPHLKDRFQVGNLRGGVLQIFAKDSVTLQELNFRKRAIVKQLQASVTQSKITDVRFRIQA